MPVKNFSTKTWINVHDDDEVAFWAKRFHVTPKDIVDTVKAIGKTVKYVELHFERKLMGKL